ncbi:MAG: hypothetical protein M1839_002456 [Geoglossum umbratile]|nr:MAG: hypothetical protein M1839_002456 [Geoglossum umbratile]
MPDGPVGKHNTDSRLNGYYGGSTTASAGVDVPSSTSSKYMDTETNYFGGPQRNENPPRATPARTTSTQVACGPATPLEHDAMTYRPDAERSFTTWGPTPMERWESESLREGHWNGLVVLAHQAIPENVSRYGGK